MDGTLSETLPRVFPPEETLYVTVDRPPSFDRIDGWPAFITALVRCNSELQNATWPDNTIVFAPPNSVGFDLDLSADGVRSLICGGYAATVSWLLSHRPARAAGVLACAVAALSPPSASCAPDAAPECAADPSDTESSPGRGTCPPP